MRANEVHMEGRVGSVYGPKGKGPWKFSVATGGGKKKDGSNWPTEWHTVIAWPNSDAGAAAANLSKGNKVEVNGRLTYNEWEKDGAKRKDAQIVADSIQTLDGSRDKGKSQYEDTEITDDTIPF